MEHTSSPHWIVLGFRVVHGHHTGFLEIALQEAIELHRKKREELWKSSMRFLLEVAYDGSMDGWMDSEEY